MSEIAIPRKPRKDEIRILSLDPGKIHDSFAAIDITVKPKDKEIYINDAVGWLQENYPQMEKDIAQLHELIHFDKIICESNNTGVHVIDSLIKIHHVPILGITTSKNIKSDKVRKKGTTMDKNEMITWIKKKKQAGKIFFPKKKTPGLSKLNNQLAAFVRKTTEAGSVSYGSEGKEHDDFAMAFIIGCYYIKTYLLREGSRQRIVLSKKWHGRDSNEIMESDLPEGAISTGMDVYYSGGITDNPQFRIR